MKRVSFIESLIAFNERVLYNGSILPKKLYTMPELKSKLFFNKIFISNMEEAFQKHNCDSIIDRYVDDVNQYVKNINMIIRKIKLFDPSITIHQQGISDHQKSNLISSEYTEEYKFVDSNIYYLSKLESGDMIVSHMESYPDAIFQKTDRCVISYLNEKYCIDNTVAFRIVSSIDDPSKTVKIEANGRIISVKTLLRKIFPNVLVLYNPFIFVDDIENIIDTMSPQTPLKIGQTFENISFDNIFEKDILIEYPTTSFDVYLHLLSSAARNKEMKAIYISLYRIGKDPMIYSILKDAVKNGIEVHVNIELYASGESINAIWADEMREAGITVTTYAVGRLKVHSKLTLFEFKSGKSISQIGTGNYHTQTTSQYTDLSLMTADKDICLQVKSIFDMFENKLDDIEFDNNLLVTRYNARDELIKLIKRETLLGSSGYISFKCNAFDDKEIAKYLDRAAANNCQIDLIVRGVCTWVPDQIGSNVRIKSIIWDKLEHSRVYCFGNFNPTMYIGSLDPTTSKLNNRIETLVKILDPGILAKLCDYLNHYITNTSNSWILLRSGEYRKEEL